MLALRRVALELFCTAALVHGQAQISSGDLTGTVTDPSGARVARAKITATNPERGYTRNAVSDDHGEYQISLLPPGEYRVRAEAPGFAVSNFESVEVRVGDTLVLPIKMVLSGTSTELNIVAEAPAVDVHRTQQASTIQERDHGRPCSCQRWWVASCPAPVA